MTYCLTSPREVLSGTFAELCPDTLETHCSVLKRREEAHT